jgi:hypothetical protein
MKKNFTILAGATLLSAIATPVAAAQPNPGTVVGEGDLIALALVVVATVLCLNAVVRFALGVVHGIAVSKSPAPDEAAMLLSTMGRRAMAAAASPASTLAPRAPASSTPARPVPAVKEAKNLLLIS